MRIEPLRVAHTLDRAARDVAFACDALAVEAEAQPGPTGLVGLCIGSGFALGALAAHGERIGPVALLDGCELGDRAGGIPQFPTGLTVPVKIWQTSDEDALADAFGTLLADAGLHPEVARLRGVPHGFCFETWSGERHRATERERTLAEVAAFLSRSSLG
jgi:dienelactone hydrolase